MDGGERSRTTRTPAIAGRRRPGAAPPQPRPLSSTEIVVRYIAFAVVATLCNLMMQRLVLAALRQGDQIAFGWAPVLLDWLLDDVAGVIAAGGGWREEWGAPASVAVAIAIGTAVGLVVKYVLDKRWIFQDLSTGAHAHARRFTLYAAIGLLTTTIFWGAEALSWHIWRTTAAREIGAILGLMVGYVAKYQLDRRFVFTPALARETPR